MRSSILLGIAIAVIASVLSGCSSGGESKNTVQYEWVSVPGYGRVLCLGDGHGIDCDFGKGER
jgi:hypothetical protein